ncbi:MAG: High-affnity carbon uptake protein Hat/HatR, partial [Deltaproteobacteria bacterium]|nr:High-affnity carbon uptake protein Hat/HatR [Deltaproteobacteria bacterium]
KDLVTTGEEDLPLGPVRTAAASDGQTLEGAVLGTPAYMPPEQAAGERVDARADVYALGALLYQLLAGVPPYTGRTTAELLNRVLDSLPIPLAEREPAVPADLVAIVEKAMARDPSARFPTAGEMVSELKRFQTGQLVASHRYTRRELAWRWVRRHRAAVAVGMIALVTLGTLGTIGLWRIFEERSRADREAALATVRADEGTLSRASAALATDPTEALALLKQLSPGAPQWRGARTIAADASSRGVAFVLATTQPVALVAFDRGGTHLVSYHPGGPAEVWDLVTLTARPIALGDHLLDLAFTTDGALLGVDDHGTVRRWELASGTPTVVRAGHGEYTSGRFSPDTTRLVLFQRFEPTTLVELGGPDRPADRKLVRYDRGAWSPDSRSLVLFDRSGAGRVDRLDLTTGTTTQVADRVQPLTVATDGTLVWIGYYDGLLRELTTNAQVNLGSPITLLTAASGGAVISASAGSRFSSQTTTLHGHDKWGGHLNIDPSSVDSGDFNVTISDGTASGNTRLRGHAAPVEVLAVGPGGRIASADRDGLIRIWSRPVVARHPGDGHTTTSQAALTRDRRELVLTRRGPALEVHELATGRVRSLAVTAFPAGFVQPPTGVGERTTRIGDRLIVEPTLGPDDEVTKLVASEDGRTLASIDAANHLVVWDLESGRGRMLREHTLDVAISPDGERLATTSEDGRLSLWDVTAGTATELGSHMAATALTFSSDGRLAVATLSPTVRVFHDHKVDELDTAGDTCRALAFADAGKTLICGGDRWLVHAWNLDTFAARTWGGHSGTITALAVSPDGRLVGSASADHTVRILSLTDGKVSELRGHTGFINSIVFGDDETVVTTSVDRTSRIWDLRAHLNRALVGHEDAVLYASPLVDPPRVLAVDRFHQIAEYPDDLPRDEAGLRAWLEAATNLTR